MLVYREFPELVDAQPHLKQKMRNFWYHPRETRLAYIQTAGIDPKPLQNDSPRSGDGLFKNVHRKILIISFSKIYFSI